jgi:hypothetical protein
MAGLKVLTLTPGGPAGRRSGDGLCQETIGHGGAKILGQTASSPISRQALRRIGNASSTRAFYGFETATALTWTTFPPRSNHRGDNR